MNAKTARSHKRHRGGAPPPVEVYVAPVTTQNLNALRLLEARNRAVSRAEGLSSIISYALAELDRRASDDRGEEIAPLADEIRRRVREVLG